MSSHIRRYLELALETLRNDLDRDEELTSFHAAIIVSGGRILSIATNKRKKNGFVSHYAHHDYCNTHAEAAAILKVISAPKLPVVIAVERVIEPLIFFSSQKLIERVETKPFLPVIHNISRASKRLPYTLYRSGKNWVRN